MLLRLVPSGEWSQLGLLLLCACSLTEAAEKAKVELSATTQTSINLPFITATAEGPKHIDRQVSLHALLRQAVGFARKSVALLLRPHFFSAAH